MKTVRIPCVLVFLLAAPAAVHGAEDPSENVKLPEGVRWLRNLPEKEEKWSAADIAVQDTLAAVSRANRHLPQEKALRAWRRLLQHEGLSRKQRAYAWWRIGSLSAYKFDPTRGESSDVRLAEEAFGKVRELLPDVVSFETLNTATVYGTLKGSPEIRAKRMAESFVWLASRTEEDVRQSARHVNAAGMLLDAKFVPRLARRETPSAEAKAQVLGRMLQKYREMMSERITDEIEYSTAPSAIEKLLDAIQQTASPEQLREWGKMHEAMLNR